MFPKRIIQHAIVLTYLALTAYAFFFTMTKIQLPFVPWPVLRYVYGMMGPYQGYNTFNSDLLAEGLVRGGEGQGWERIDLDPYYPMHRGTAIMYRRLRSFHAEGEEVHKQKYTELAQLLLERENRKRGKNYASVRLTWQEWPTSSEGFEAMRREPHITHYFITQVP